jgi:hypothetical protein
LSIRRITLIAAPTIAGAFVVLGAPAVMAQGQTEMGPQNSNSICSYSGLNDEPQAEYPEGGRTQNYGQLVRQGVIAPREARNMGPGTECNGHKNPWQQVTGSH